MLLVLFVLIPLIGSVFAVPAQSVPYFAGRSANIIIQPENAVSDNSAILLGKHFESQLKTIEDTEVADLFAHVMGTQPFNVLASREGFPKGDLFQKPKATLLVTLESVDHGLFVKYALWKGYQSVGLTTSTYPANSHTMASNIATGTKPSVHGIVGEAWVLPNGEKIDAHTSEDGSSLAANIADILTQEWDGRSLTVSASASLPLASAFAASSQFSHAHGYGLFLEDGAFSTIYSHYALNPFTVTEEALQAIFKAAAFSSFLGASVVSSNDKVMVTVGSTTVTFDLKSSDDYVLFAELGFVFNFLNVLETDSGVSVLVGDSVPDFYSFAFASLKGIKSTYGENSDIFVASIKLVDCAIQQTAAKLEALYGRIVSAVVCLDTQSVVSDKIKTTVYESARASLQHQEDFELHFPSLYVRNGKVAQTCQQVRSALGPLAEVHCFSSSFDWVAEDPNILPTNTTLPDLNVAAFWIFIFFPITLLLIILVGVYGLCAAGVEASKDSLLFRSAGRHH
jgi:hypothetical protein